MVFGGIVTSPRGTLSPFQALDLARVYLENANRMADVKILLVLCHDTEMSLSQAKRAAKHTNDPTLKAGIGHAYIGLGNLLRDRGHQVEAQSSFKKAQALGVQPLNMDQLGKPFVVNLQHIEIGKSEPDTIIEALNIPSVSPHTSTMSLDNQRFDIATVHRHIFARNVHPPAMEFKPPEPDARLNDTPQLACCLGLLGFLHNVDDISDPTTRTWLQLVKNEPDEQERLKTLATDVVRAFKRDEIKDTKAVIEMVYLAPVLEKDDFRYLLKEFYSGIEQSTLLDIHQLEGLAQLIQGADKSCLDADDLVKVLQLLSTRLIDTHQQSTKRLYQLTLAVSHVLDAMADAGMEGLDRETLHAPLESYLDGLKESTDAYLVYQAAYAYQALLYVPDDESLWQATVRRTGKVFRGVAGMAFAVKTYDFNGFMDGLRNIQKGLEGASKVAAVLKTGYGNVTSLTTSGKGLYESLKEGFSFDFKSAWYPALRRADALIVDGHLSEFKMLVCEAPCRRDPAFQWGVCQRLGEVAANPAWDSETRRGAIAFLGEIYANDEEWGQEASVKQWILGILMEISSQSGDEMQFAGTLLQDLRRHGDATKQELYRMCSENGRGSHPLGIAPSAIGSPSLLDRVQARPDVEGSLRQLRRQRLKGRENVVYVSPQAKAGLQAPDEDRLPLKDSVDTFLASDQRVFLVLGDSGSGKSTFSCELECTLWKSYKKNGLIPLYISLPAIDKPEHDMIAKQLRKAEFTDPQIRELKFHREFILICDGYDESQQTHNLYTRNQLNEPGEWQAKMVISCRSEYLGVDYRDRFLPRDRYNRPDPTLFQEAVITPFSVNQIQDYIDQYVALQRRDWGADEYKKALELVPSLKELVKNPFLMSLTLEVLPRLMDKGQDLSTTHITRVELYDRFIEHWLERGKRRLGEKNLSPQASAAFESLTDEGFVQSGTHFLKRLCTAIYKNQHGQPIVRYSRYRDEGTWKTDFFSREDERQLLREACPLIRNGNQYRFVHRSLLEYGVALAIFDPQDWKERNVPQAPLTRRMSIQSDVSSDEQDPVEEMPVVFDQEPEPNSPLVWRSFVKESSIIQFLEERVQQEPHFKQLLLDYIEQSKSNKKWRTAASNAITILARAGVQFKNADLRGIRIPRADLSYGMFDSSQFQGADLRHVDFRGAWLRQANLSDAQMKDAQFGELPLLKHDAEVRMCVYSPDGKTIAAGLSNHKISVSSTSNCERLWTLEGHSGDLTSIVYSPDGTQIASSSRDKSARLWDVDSDACIHDLKGHDDEVLSVAYSPCGDQVISASKDRTVKVWDSKTGDCHHTMFGHDEGVSGAIYSPLGNQIASISLDNTVRLWDVEKEKTTIFRILRGHEQNVYSVVYSPQGDQVASGSMDKTIRLWDVASGNCLYTLKGHTGDVKSVMYSPDGAQVASCSSDNSVRLWDTRTGECAHTLHGHTNPVASVVYSPQGNLVASASDDKTVRIWDAKTGICRQTLTGHSSGVTSAVFSPIEDRVASSSTDKTVRLWNVGTGTSHISNAHAGSVTMVKLSPTDSCVATCGDNTVRIWDVEKGGCLRILRDHLKVVNCIAYSPQGHQIASGSSDLTVRLWNTATGECTRILEADQIVCSITYSPSGDQIASGHDGRKVRLWNVESGECLRTLTAHSTVRGVMYSSTGSHVITYGPSSTVQVWETATGNCTPITHNSEVSSVAYSPRGNRNVSASVDNSVHVWEVGTGKRCSTLAGHNVSLSFVTYSPNGDQIAFGDKDGLLKVWDIGMPSCRWTSSDESRHSERISRIAYSSQGDLVVSASKDKSVRLWDAASGQCQAVIRGFQGRVNDIAWIEDSQGANYLATGCEDGMVGMWKVESTEDGRAVSLHWGTVKGELNVMDATIQNVHGLSHLNRDLLMQRGAEGELMYSHDATSTSMALGLTAASNETEENPALPDDPSIEQLEQWLEQGKCVLGQEFVASIAKIIRRQK